jgi:SAM-dependent methyltransferase
MECMAAQTTSWNSELYQSSHAFVWQFGRDLLNMLAPKAGERILDVGCGTGQLTADIANSGAAVVGIDLSAEMIAAASANFPQLRFEVADIAAAERCIGFATRTRPSERLLGRSSRAAVSSLRWAEEATSSRSGMQRYRRYLRWE